MVYRMTNSYQTCVKDLQDKFLKELGTKKDEVYKQTNDCFTKAWLVKDNQESIEET